ncbi:MAG: 4Fe-4S binding protein [Mogibacterium sp.]|nr:4Fe-4S binding protein [Mogibacterium sp.]
MISRVVGLYFSPSGETAKITKRISAEIAARMNDVCLDPVTSEFHDLLREPPAGSVTIGDDAVVIIGMPAYNGRIPSHCADLIRRIHASGNLAIVVVAYGNSSYGDALYELNSFAETQGFRVVSAGAFISQHPMFERIAEHRPDARDLRELLRFCEASANKMKRFCGTDFEELRGRVAPLHIKGQMPAKEPVRTPLHPSANGFCIRCGACSAICPVHAIDPTDPARVDPKRCISCTACIRVCEQDARGFYGPMCAASRLALERIYSKRKEPEWFI